jgi:hypothetical protein
VGPCASYDDDLGSGYRHVAAVKEGGKLKVYIDGDPAATSVAFAARDYDLTNEQPLKIGVGETDFFSGRMRDIRLYGRALTAPQVRRLYHETKQSKNNWGQDSEDVTRCRF